jgi:hypothetical protein
LWAGHFHVNLQAMPLTCPRCHSNIATYRVKASFACATCRTQLNGRTGRALLACFALWTLADFGLALLLGATILNEGLAFALRVVASGLVGVLLYTYGLPSWSEVVTKDGDHAS